MQCLLCENNYPQEQVQCPNCSNNLQTLKPYSPHLSQLIRIGEEVCKGTVTPEKLDKATKFMVQKLDKAEDKYFEYEAGYTMEDRLILQDYLNNLLESEEFLRKTLEEIIKALETMDIKKIYTELDKAKIAEKMFLNAVAKLRDLSEEDIEKIAEEKGIKLKK